MTVVVNEMRGGVVRGKKGCQARDENWWIRRIRRNPDLGRIAEGELATVNLRNKLASQQIYRNQEMIVLSVLLAFSLFLCGISRELSNSYDL